MFLQMPISAQAADSYTLAAGATGEINEHGTCQRVTNNNSLSIMVPTKTSGEWASFRSAAPGVTMGACYTYAHGAWGTFGTCSATCGGGSQTRTRSCIRSPDNVPVDCSLCGGGCSQSQACNTHSCTKTCTMNQNAACSGSVIRTAELSSVAACKTYCQATPGVNACYYYRDRWDSGGKVYITQYFCQAMASCSIRGGDQYAYAGSCS